MPPTVTPDPLAPATAARLSELARAMKAAAHAVSLYPAAHPAIAQAMQRLLDATSRASSEGLVAITVMPDHLLVDGRAMAKPDVAVVEMAALLHGHLVGELRVDPAVTTAEWRTFLLLLSRSVEEIRAEGGFARALTTTGAHHLQVHEIDYAEVLRERGAGVAATWNAIIANCLQGERAALDEQTVHMLLGLVEDAERFGDLIAELQAQAVGRRQGVGAQVAALLRMLRGMIDRLAEGQPAQRDRILDNVAAATARLSPEVMLAFVGRAHAAESEASDVAGTVLSRVSDATVARFVARAVVSDRGATERLAQAFQALVTDEPRRAPILDDAERQVRDSPFGADPGFPEVWKTATRRLLTTYSDAKYVSEAYARELTQAPARAIEVERTGDDPPERIGAWLSTVSEATMQQIDERLLLDLLRIEAAPDRWGDVADTVAGRIEQLTLRGDFRRAAPLLNALVQSGTSGREDIRPAAASAVERLASGPLMRHLVVYLRKVEDAELPPIVEVCRSLGTVVVRPLAEALAAEEGGRSLRRLRDLLVGFGAAGREAVEQLKHSPNVAVRRTAVNLLRIFGGREALPELAALLEDSDPQVQRDAIRAITQIGTDDAFQVLEHALSSRTSRSREAIIQSVGALRDERAAPLFCYVLRHTDYRGALQPVHLAIIEALGGLSEADHQAVAALRDVLHRGQWWAPGRTAMFRRAAATALRRLGTAAALRVLEEAAETGSRGVRAIARTHLSAGRATGGERRP